MGKHISLVLKFVALFVFTCILSACQNSTQVNDIEKKGDIKSLIQEGKYIEIQEFIIADDGKKPLIEYAVFSLFKTNKSENDAFLNDMFQNYIENKKWIDIQELTSGLEEEKNMEIVGGIHEEIDIYNNLVQEKEELDAEKDNLIVKGKELEETYPYELKWDGFAIQEFQGTILQKISDTEYRVDMRYSPTNKEYILHTVEKTFSSAGDFGMYVIPGEEIEYTLQDGFSKSFLTVHEIPEEQIDLVTQIINSRVNISKLMKEIEENKGNQMSSIDNMERQFENIFKMEKAEEILKKNDKTKSGHNESKIFTVLKNKLYIDGITLGTERNEVLEILGNPDEEKIDDSPMDPSDTILIYDNVSFYIFDNKVIRVSLHATNEFFDKEFLSNYSGDRYISEEGKIYFYEPDSKQLIIASGVEEEFQISLVFEDGNFKYNVQEGSIKKVEDSKSEKQTEPGLEEGNDTADNGYNSYTNDRYGFSVQYPNNFIMDPPSQNGDGATFHNDEFFLTAYSGYTNVIKSGETIEEYFQEDLESINEEIAYQKLSDNWYVISYKENEKIIYKKFYFGDVTFSTFIITYPASKQEEYGELTTYISNSFVPSLNK